VSGSYDRNLRIWDISSGTCLTILIGHFSYVTCVCQLFDGRLVSSGFDKTLRIWNVKTEIQQRWERRRLLLLLVKATSALVNENVVLDVTASDTDVNLGTFYVLLSVLTNYGLVRAIAAYL
jgi:WD40 repeat protein